MYCFFLNIKLCIRIYGLYVLIEIIGIVLIAIDVSCFFNLVVRLSIYLLVSYFGTEYIKIGVLVFIW